MLDEQQVYDSFLGGVNCAMLVFGALAPRLGLDEETARRLTSGLGGGMEHGGICGAVCGGVLALGLARGYHQDGDLQGRREFLTLKREFEDKFRERFAGLSCPEVLGCDKFTPEGKQRVKEEGLMQTICAPAVCAAVEIVEEMLELD